MNMITRIILCLLVLAVFVLGSSYLVGHGTITATVGLILWAIGIAAAILTFVKTKKK